jgi:GH25 family lysozyme M1 (1,4-beta-N-acetylmuramidase)
MTISSTPVRGPDLSHHQAAPNWSLLAAPASYVYLKATQITATVDDRPRYLWTDVAGNRHDAIAEWFVPNWTKAKAQLVANEVNAIGAYHYLTAGPVGSAQADFYCNTMEAAGVPTEGFLPPVVDVEAGGFSGDPHALKDRIIDRISAWADRVFERWGRTCTVYGRRLLLDADIHKSDLSSRCEHLWLPRYTSDIAATHADAKVLGWDDWTWWQYTDGEAQFPVPVDHDGDPWPRSVAGIGPCDVNVFNGDEAALRSLAASTLPARTDPGGDDDVALTEKQAAALDWLAANMNRLEGLLDGIQDGSPPDNDLRPGTGPYMETGRGLAKLAADRLHRLRDEP